MAAAPAKSRHFSIFSYSAMKACLLRYLPPRRNENALLDRFAQTDAFFDYHHSEKPRPGAGDLPHDGMELRGSNDTNQVKSDVPPMAIPAFSHPF
jgi:hypothetical protein